MFLKRFFSFFGGRKEPTGGSLIRLDPATGKRQVPANQAEVKKLRRKAKILVRIIMRQRRELRALKELVWELMKPLPNTERELEQRDERLDRIVLRWKEAGAHAALREIKAQELEEIIDDEDPEPPSAA